MKIIDLPLHATIEQLEKELEGLRVNYVQVFKYKTIHDSIEVNRFFCEEITPISKKKVVSEKE